MKPQIFLWPDGLVNIPNPRCNRRKHAILLLDLHLEHAFIQHLINIKSYNMLPSCINIQIYFRSKLIIPRSTLDLHLINLCIIMSDLRCFNTCNPKPKPGSDTTWRENRLFLLHRISRWKACKTFNFNQIRYKCKHNSRSDIWKHVKRRIW